MTQKTQNVSLEPIVMNSDGLSPTFLQLNPNTSLAYLPPDIATQLEATRYLSVAVLGVKPLPYHVISCHLRAYRFLPGIFYAL